MFLNKFKRIENLMRFLVHQTLIIKSVLEKVDFQFIVLLRSGGSNIICQVNSKPTAQLRQF